MHKHTNPVDYWNSHHSWHESFQSAKVDWISDNQITTDKGGKPCFEIIGPSLHVLDQNGLKLQVGEQYSKFEILTATKFKGNPQAAYSWVNFKFLRSEVPYIRVGTDYFKVTSKVDRYGVKRTILKGWKKDEIKGDHGAELIPQITKFDDFCIEPDNTDYELIIDNCYNLYAPFSHKPLDEDFLVTEANFPVSMNLIKHIFGEQWELGIKYLKLLYENPRQPLPILCLVSKERQTGKTTFLNWMQIIFGDNYCQINPEDLNSQFNSIYATKNLIALDETVIDKSHAVEKLKSIATAKSISVNQKYVANYSIPFFGKVIICTNKEKDFMRIDEEEIRFWVRKVPQIASINTNIEADLKREVPAFLRYLMNQPAIDTKRSRMVFTADELENKSLSNIKKESWSWLRKDLSLYLSEYFEANSQETTKANLSDIKEKFFRNNNQVTISYLKKVLNEEMGIHPVDGRYVIFDTDSVISKVGRHYEFHRADFINSKIKLELEENLPY